MKTLADLKPGDPVEKRHGSTYERGTVLDVTKTQIRLADGSRWLIRTGRRIGAPTWDRTRLYLWDDGHHAERTAAAELTAARNSLVARFTRVCARLTPEQITRLHSIFDEVDK